MTLSFEPARFISFSNDPTNVVVADLNGDGIPDLVTVDDTRSFGAEGSIFLGQGGGRFASETHYVSAGPQPAAVAVADVNGDGIPDLVVASFGNGTSDNGEIGVLLGNGHGGFSAPTTDLAAPHAQSVAVADLTGAGRPDIIDVAGGMVNVLTNEGRGVFAASASYKAGSAPVSVAVGDLNGDGHPDLVVAGSDGIEVLTSDGRGGFLPAVSYGAGVAAHDVVLADINGDGHPDIVAIADGKVEVLLNDGRGFAAPVDVAAGANPASVAVGDLNGDGKADLAVANLTGGPNGTGSMDLLAGDGKGGFANPVVLAAGFYPDAVAIADVNGDGKPDVVVGDLQGGVGLLLNDGVPCFARGTRISVPGGAAPVERIAAGDLIVTAAGERRHVIWAGCRTVDVARHPDPDRVRPVVIGAGAFADGAPSRDLVVSPDHNLFLDGVLIPAKCLVDGASVTWSNVSRVTYHHIELAAHDLVLAEGLAVETYLDTGNRSSFEGGAVVEAFADFASAPDLNYFAWEARGCARLVLAGPELDAARERRASRRAGPAIAALLSDAPGWMNGERIKVSGGQNV